MNLRERFKKYTPSQEMLPYMDFTVTNTKADVPNRMIEVTVEFPYLVTKETLYKLENEIKLAYELNYMRVFPKYPSHLFTKAYLDEVIKEAYRQGAIAKGFFNDYSLEFSDSEIVFRIPFIQGGIDLLSDASTSEIFARIIKREFGLDYNVKILQRDDFMKNVEIFEARKLDILRHALEELHSTSKEEKKDDDEKNYRQDFKKSNSFYTEDVAFENKGNIIKCGFCEFNIEGKEYVTGGEFDIKNIVPIRNLRSGMHDVCVLGTVFNIEEKQIKRGSQTIINVGITDKDSSVYIKINIPTEKRAEELSYFKKGSAYAIRGNVKTDDFDSEIYISYLDVCKINLNKRIDNAEEKRVELHLHTKMSQMDATIDPDELIDTVKAWGHRAIAITDHGNVQGYQQIMKASEKAGVKVIYGMEAYFVNDSSRSVYGDKITKLDEEFCVFDLETTGLSNKSDKITEIGAVIVKNGEIIDRYSTFVNPERPIPEKIVEITHITDDMVKDAPKIDEVLPEFLAFVGERTLVAHNANFDVGFIRQACNEVGLDFKCTYIDTVALSKFINPELKKHKLNSLADYFNLGEFNHHRAYDDAEMLANILECMFEKLRGEGIYDTSSINHLMNKNADPLSLPSNHQIILVKNKTGLKNLYKLVSDGFLKYYKRHPRIPKSNLVLHREGLIIGSACEAGELFQAIIDNRSDDDIEEIANFYDYLEIQPLCNNRFLIAEGRASGIEDLKNFNRRIVQLGEKLGKPVVATCDAHFMNKEDEITRKILLSGQKFKDADNDTGIYFRTTEEMLKEFEYLGKEKAYEVVVTNTNKIADMIDYDNIRPFPKGTFTPKMEGAEEDLTNMCWERAKSMYEFEGKIPEVVSSRLEKELTSIIQNGFAVLYMIAQKLVYYSESLGYLVGSRGSVGSSFVATMAGISEVNPLQPHYRCPKCRYSEFITDGSIGSGFDLPDKCCPHCGEKLMQDGHDIPFETFLGFKGDKSPDIDLNFSGDVQGRVHKYTEDLFGAENVFRAGTISGIAPKTSYGYVAKYMDEHQLSVNKAELQRLVDLCTGVKRTTGQHPGGIVVVPKEYEIYDFCPVQHPADDVHSDIVTTHFTFEYLHDTLLKLDELGHDIPTKYKMIEQFTNTSVLDVPMNDPEVYGLFLSTKPLGGEDLLKGLKCSVGTYGLPEFGTKFVQQMLVDAKPKNFSDLLQISGLSHGTDVWLGNAQDLIKQGICTISEVVGTRDSIMLYLIYNGLEKGMAFKIMEDVRKGRGLTAEYEQAMRDNNIPEWYITSCKKIKYMFPKAHAAAYVISAIRLAWYKVHMPMQFYAAYLSVAPGGFESSMVENGLSGILTRIEEIEAKGTEATQKEKETVVALQIAYECLARGIEFLPVSFLKSDSSKFLPENGKIRLPFSSIAGIGDNASIKIAEARMSGDVYSVEDFQQKTRLTKAVMDLLERNHVFDEMSKSNQLSFDI